jgi:hypothetical protein
MHAGKIASLGGFPDDDEWPLSEIQSRFHSQAPWFTLTDQLLRAYD